MNKMNPRSVDPFSSPDEAKIATSSAPVGQDEYIFPLSDFKFTRLAAVSKYR